MLVDENLGGTDQLIIERTGEIFVPQLEIAITAWQRFLGLMGREKLAEGTALWLAPCASIHMMFMKFPIDVVWLSSQKVVMKISSDVRPWYGFAACYGAMVALEVPVGVGQRVVVGDRLIRT